MTFTENSGLVKVWVALIKSRRKTLDQVPELYNLKEVVAAVLAA